jgi:Nuclease-related domain
VAIEVQADLLALLWPVHRGWTVVLLIDRHLWSWGGGAVWGVAAGAWIAMRETPPRYIEKWHDGAEGERKTEKALKGLERSGLRVVHDVQARYGNYDHVAVGPAGVFLLDSKNLTGIVELRGGVPHLRQRLDPDADTRCDWICSRALACAASLKEDIQRQTGHRVWVQAVVVLWCEFPEQLVEAGQCVFVHGSTLHDWLESRPAELDPAKAEEIAAAVDRMATQEASLGSSWGPK